MYVERLMACPSVSVTVGAGSILVEPPTYAKSGTNPADNADDTNRLPQYIANGNECHSNEKEFNE